MADYRLSAAVVKRREGRSVVAAAAYRAGAFLSDERTGIAHDYTRRSGVLAEEIMLPEGAPTWMADREKLWNSVEATEKPRNAQLARDIELSLPHEVSPEARIALVRDFVQQHFVSKGMVADVAWHVPSRAGDQRNFHAPVLLTMRETTPDGFSQRKNRDWNSVTLLRQWREQWAEIQNRYLRQELGERAPKVSHLSLAEQGIEREPQRHLGPSATALERRRERSDRGNQRRAVVDRNARVRGARERADALAVRIVKPIDKPLAQVATEMQTLVRQCATERAGLEGQLRKTLDQLKGKRNASPERVRQAAMRSFGHQVQDAARELDQARRSAGISLTPSQILAWYRSPAAMLWQQMKRSIAVDRAVAKLERAARARVKAERWLESSAGRQFVADRVTALRQEYSPLRVTERRLRRGIARLDRDIKAANGSAKVAMALKEGEFARTIATPSPALDGRRYVEGVQHSLRGTVRQLQPQQRQALQRLISLGIGLGRGM